MTTQRVHPSTILRVLYPLPSLASLALRSLLPVLALPWRQQMTGNFQLSTFNLQLPAAMRLIQLGSLISALLADKLPPLFFFDVRYFLSRTVPNEQHSTLSQSNHISRRDSEAIYRQDLPKKASAKLLKFESHLSISNWRDTFQIGVTSWH